MTEASSGPPLVIPPPRRDRPPLRANIFAAMQKGNTALMPLFPYLHPGAMVPAGAVLQGGPNRSYGHFFHHNTVDEVVVAFAANGSLLQTGQVFVGGRVHGVNSFLKDEKDPASYAVMCITQRQSEGAPQNEAISVQCAKCRREVFRRDFEVTPPADALETDYPFPTLVMTLEVFRDYNADAMLRTCGGCGHVNEPFPAAAWGWDVYVSQSEKVIDGRKSLAAVAERAHA
jgi:hypothetical protein